MKTPAILWKKIHPFSILKSPVVVSFFLSMFVFILAIFVWLNAFFYHQNENISFAVFFSWRKDEWNKEK